mmetsp:Transcript_37742/g.61163  ORF Transcript_37742/g.61163 Transcript_37742/m.61163 type:complete len:644 (+) Transcript_37742:122-2053(+)|eukprot:CAMPEP_0184671544 /NCGR_PEP_ID=MMETSP0308-20130426/85555_1 /TAXON_ID=38269 /ORGANISM="Gloeochaete witrockiana, Strain SAG 46.84" /LENGTH=643 /DNA_ID=CAMNT_0027118701 /DNA_START=91 /DNA_END=2022 /DNA_ORIENTATION=+
MATPQSSRENGTPTFMDGGVAVDTMERQLHRLLSLQNELHESHSSHDAQKLKRSSSHGCGGVFSTWGAKRKREKQLKGDVKLRKLSVARDAGELELISTWINLVSELNATSVQMSRWRDVMRKCQAVLVQQPNGEARPLQEIQAAIQEASTAWHSLGDRLRQGSRPMNAAGGTVSKKGMFAAEMEHLIEAGGGLQSELDTLAAVVLDIAGEKPAEEGGATGRSSEKKASTLQRTASTVLGSRLQSLAQERDVFSRENTQLRIQVADLESRVEELTMQVEEANSVSELQTSLGSQGLLDPKRAYCDSESGSVSPSGSFTRGASPAGNRSANKPRRLSVGSIFDGGDLDAIRVKVERLVRERDDAQVRIRKMDSEKQVLVTSYNKRLRARESELATEMDRAERFGRERMELAAALEEQVMATEELAGRLKLESKSCERLAQENSKLKSCIEGAQRAQRTVSDRLERMTTGLATNGGNADNLKREITKYAEDARNITARARVAKALLRADNRKTSRVAKVVSKAVSGSAPSSAPGTPPNQSRRSSYSGATASTSARTILPRTSVSTPSSPIPSRTPRTPLSTTPRTPLSPITPSRTTSVSTPRTPLSAPKTPLSAPKTPSAIIRKPLTSSTARASLTSRSPASRAA